VNILQLLYTVSLTVMLTYQLHSQRKAVANTERAC